jgi:hypothetical protein
MSELPPSKVVPNKIMDPLIHLSTHSDPLIRSIALEIVLLLLRLDTRSLATGSNAIESIDERYNHFIFSI